MGERERGAKVPRNKNLERLHNQKLNEPMTKSKRSYN
jgi:hypothetical protein